MKDTTYEIPDKKKYSTWSDYKDWPDDERWEIIGGRPFAMTPSPRDRHQLVCAKLAREMGMHFKDRNCEVIAAPMDVKLSEKDIVQPDILVVCDAKQFKGHIEGPPALVVEILSPSTEGHDRIRKLNLYAKFGIEEYWLVNPYPHIIEMLVLEGNGYRIHATYGAEDILRSPSFPDLEIDLKTVFDIPIPPEERIQEVREDSPPYATSATR